MSTPARENARAADGGTVKTPSSVRARSIDREGAVRRDWGANGCCGWILNLTGRVHARARERADGRARTS